MVLFLAEIKRSPGDQNISNAISNAWAFGVEQTEKTGFSRMSLFCSALATIISDRAFSSDFNRLQIDCSALFDKFTKDELRSSHFDSYIEANERARLTSR